MSTTMLATNALARASSLLRAITSTLHGHFEPHTVHNLEVAFEDMGTVLAKLSSPRCIRVAHGSFGEPVASLQDALAIVASARSELPAGSNARDRAAVAEDALRSVLVVAQSPANETEDSATDALRSHYWSLMDIAEHCHPDATAFRKAVLEAAAAVRIAAKMRDLELSDPDGILPPFPRSRYLTTPAGLVSHIQSLLHALWIVAPSGVGNNITSISRSIGALSPHLMPLSGSIADIPLDSEFGDELKLMSAPSLIGRALTLAAAIGFKSRNQAEREGSEKLVEILTGLGQSHGLTPDLNQQETSAADGDSEPGTARVKSSTVFQYACYLLHAYIRGRGLADGGKLSRMLDELRVWGYRTVEDPYDPEVEVDDIRIGETRAWTIRTASPVERSEPPAPPPSAEDVPLLAETRRALDEAADEIVRLRRRNAELEDRQRVVDFMIRLSRGIGDSGAMTPDSVYHLARLSEAIGERLTPHATAVAAVREGAPA